MIVRELADPEYATSEPPTHQDMVDAIAAYELEKLNNNAGWKVPDPAIARLESIAAACTAPAFPDDSQPLGNHHDDHH